MARRILILGFPNALLMDITGPAQVFSSANKSLCSNAYQIEIVTRDGHDTRTDAGISLRAQHSFTSSPQMNDLLIPGGPGVDMLLEDTQTLEFIRKSAAVAQRVVSICSGSLLAAAAGLLDGKQATSHWERSALIRAQFPRVAWQLDRIFTHDGKFHCSAGVTSGIDLALNLLEADHGRDIALEVAREMVVFIRRAGGQSQYSRPLRAQSTANHRLSDLYARIEADPSDDWTVSRMADLIGITERTLHRDFMRDLSMSPARYVEERRMGIARSYLERGDKSLKEIARLSGFTTEQNLRRSFKRVLGVLPSEYRHRFGVFQTVE